MNRVKGAQASRPASRPVPTCQGSEVFGRTACNVQLPLHTVRGLEDKIAMSIVVGSDSKVASPATELFLEQPTSLRKVGRRFSSPRLASSRCNPCDVRCVVMSVTTCVSFFSRGVCIRSATIRNFRKRPGLDSSAAKTVLMRCHHIPSVVRR